jgi:hypothetical protein
LKYSDCGGASVDPAQIETTSVPIQYNDACTARKILHPARETGAVLSDVFAVDSTNCPNLPEHTQHSYRKAFTNLMPRIEVKRGRNNGRIVLPGQQSSAPVGDSWVARHQ